MKKTVVMILVLAVAASISAAAVGFTDIDASSQLGKDAGYLSERGVIGGYGDQTFRPQGKITRAELAKVINLVFNYKELSESSYPDVTADKWYYEYAIAAKKAGYIGGYEDGTFRGDNYVTKEQFCAIITRTMGLYKLYEAEISDEVSLWAEDYVKTVLSNQLMSTQNGKFFAKSDITRGEVVTVLANYVRAQESVGNIIITKPPKTDGEPEEITAIRNGISQVSAIFDTFNEQEKKVISPCLEGMKKAIYDYENFGATIDRNYIHTHYADLIKQAQSAYNALSSIEHSLLKGKLIDGVDAQTMGILSDYFMGE